MQGMVLWRQMGLNEALAEVFEKSMLIMVEKHFRECQTEHIGNHALFSLKV